ncbi:MAG TPA: LysR family transcriptional regulator [Paraburkholderia sp.]|jgi:DNA-binding transcriptional LysR family regulator
MNDLNPREIRAFLAIVEVGSFTRAATRLNVSQPALTVQIQRLEDVLQTRLFDRNSRNVALTPIGRTLVPMLQKCVQDMENVLRDAKALGEGTKGEVRIACLPSFAASLLPDLITLFRREAPDATFRIHDAVAKVIGDLVLNESVDLGLTGGALFDPSIEVLHSSEDRLCVVCPKGHPLAKKRRISVADIASHPLVLTAKGTSVRDIMDAAFRSNGYMPEVTCEPTYMMTAVAMVRAGLGLTVLPVSTREIQAEPGLVARVIEPKLGRPVALVSKRGRTLSPMASAFLQKTIEAMKRVQ